VTLDLRVVNRAELLRQMAENVSDLGIMVRVPANADLVAEPFAPHPYVIVARPGHPLAKRSGAKGRSRSPACVSGRRWNSIPT